MLTTSSTSAGCMWWCCVV